MNAEITYKQEPTGFSVKIKPRLSSAQLNIIRLWIILWSLSGMIVIAQFFGSYPGNVKLLLLIWTAFWAYFLVKGINLNLWKTTGQEFIEIRNGEFRYTKNTGMKIVHQLLLTEEISRIETIDFKTAGGKWRADNSFISIGEPCITIESLNNKISFGFQITEEDCIKIRKAIKKFSK